MVYINFRAGFTTYLFVGWVAKKETELTTMVRLDNERNWNPTENCFLSTYPSILLGVLVGAAGSLCGWQMVQLWNTI
jgi:hypothetical protein